MPVAAGGTRTSGGMFTTLSAPRPSDDLGFESSGKCCAARLIDKLLGKEPKD